MKSFKEFTNEAKRKSKSDFEVYHKSYTNALQAAYDLAKNNGYELNDDEIWNQVSTGPKRPSAGKTNRITLSLYKGGHPAKPARYLQIQVYGMEGGTYELNAYIG